MLPDKGGRMEVYMLGNVMIALEIMGKGMAGIFVAILVIMLAVQLLAKVTNRPKKEEE